MPRRLDQELPLRRAQQETYDTDKSLRADPGRVGSLDGLNELAERLNVKFGRG